MLLCIGQGTTDINEQLLSPSPVTIIAGSGILLLYIDDWSEIESKQKTRCNGHHNATKHNNTTQNRRLNKKRL